MAQVQSMIPDLMGIVNRQLTPDVIRRIASQLGEDRERTASAVSTSVPSVLTALSDVANSDTGAAHLKETIDETRHAPSHDPSDLGAVAHPGSTPPTTNGHRHASTLLEDELGPRSSSIAEAVAHTSGIKTDSARQILGGVSSVAVAAIAKTVGGTGFSSLRTVLGSQRGEWMKKLPVPVASLFNGGSTAATSRERTNGQGYARATTVERASTGPAIRELETHRARPAWLYPAILAGLALLAIPFIRRANRGSVSPPTTPQVTRPEAPSSALPRNATPPTPEAAPAAQQAATPTPTPTAAAPEPAAQPENTPTPVAAAPAEQPQPTPAAATATPAIQAATTQNGMKQLAAFLSGAQGSIPGRFTLSPLNFAFGSTKLTPGSMSTVDDLAGLLNDNPGAKIRLESFSDNVGTPEVNQQLSGARSESIKSLLTARGVDGSRIETAGLGQERPIASNDTPEGRAQNRRTDVVVLMR